MSLLLPKAQRIPSKKWRDLIKKVLEADPPEPDEPIIEPWLEDPFPDYDHEPVFARN